MGISFNHVLLAEFTPRQHVLTETSHLRGTYYSEQVFAQTQVSHCLFLHFHSLLGLPSNAVGKIRLKVDGIKYYLRRISITSLTAQLFLYQQPGFYWEIFRQKYLKKFFWTDPRFKLETAYIAVIHYSWDRLYSLENMDYVTDFRCIKFSLANGFCWHLVRI